MKKRYLLGLLLLIVSFKNHAQSGAGNQIVRDSTTTYGTKYKYNTIYGTRAGFVNTTNNGASDNTLVGYLAGLKLSSDMGGNYGDPFNNTFIGSRAGVNSIYTQNNVSIGAFSSFSSTGTYESVAIGAYAGYSASTTYHNTFIGFQAGYSNTNSENVLIGYKAGYSASTYAAVLIGNEAGGLAIGTNNSVVIGYRAGYNLNANNAVFIGANAGLEVV